MNSLNDVLSKTLQVKPLAPGETAQFELVNRYKKEPGREEPSCPELWAISEKEMIYDPGANNGMGGSVLIQNIIGFEPKEIAGSEGRMYNKPVLKKPEFIKGVLTVGHEENNTYIFLMRSKKNIMNPFRGSKTRAVFRPVNLKKETYDQIQVLDLQWQAEKLIRESDWNVSRTIRANLNKSPDQRFHIKSAENDLQGMKLELIQIAKSNPKKIIMASSDVESKNRVYIADALQFNILIWTESTRTWSLYDSNSKEKDKVNELTIVDADKDKVDALLDHFKTEVGRKHYTLFVHILTKIFKVAST